MNFFICYDISDDKLRLRLSKLLLRSGCVRVQKSVFVATDFERAEMLRLKIKVERLVCFVPRNGNVLGAPASGALSLRDLEAVTASGVRQSGASPNDSVLYIPLDNDAVKDVVWQGNKHQWENLWKKEDGKFL